MLKESWDFVKSLFTNSINLTPQSPKGKYFYKFESFFNDSKTFDSSGYITKYNNADEIHLEVARKARGIYNSVGIISGAIITLKSEILGERGLLIDVNTENQEVNDLVEKRFTRWSKNVGYGKSLYRLQHELLHHYFIDGEVFIYLKRDGDNLVLTLLDTFRLVQHTDEKKNIFFGIKYDSLGNPEYYYFTNRYEDSMYVYDLENTVKIPAEDIIHFKNGHTRRGLSFLTPCIDLAYDSNRLLFAEIRRGITSSQIIGFMKTPAILDTNCGAYNNSLNYTDDGKLIRGGATEDKEEYTIEANTLAVLPGGAEPHFASPTEPADLPNFMNSFFYYLGGCLGLTYPTLTGDLSKVNYSSIRAGSLRERRYYGVIQEFLDTEILSVIFEAWMKHPANYGKSRLSRVTEDILDNYTFKKPTWLHVDPVKEANSIKVQLEQGITTLSEVLKNRGKDFEEHKQELERDIELAELVATKNTLMDDVADNEIYPDETDEEEPASQPETKKKEKKK